MHFDLMIPREGIHETKEFMFGDCINNHINLWQTKTVFRAGLVQVSEINAYSPLLPLFRGDDDVSQPICVVGFSNDIGLYDLQTFRDEFSSFL